MSTARAHWTDEMLAFAQAKRAAGHSLASIDAMLGLQYGATWYKLRMLDPKHREKQREYDRNHRWRRRKVNPDKRHVISVVEPPAESLAEREAALDEPRDLTALLMGDPPPSRSALARKQQAANP